MCIAHQSICTIQLLFVTIANMKKLWSELILFEELNFTNGSKLGFLRIAEQAETIFRCVHVVLGSDSSTGFTEGRTDQASQ